MKNLIIIVSILILGVFGWIIFDSSKTNNAKRETKVEKNITPVVNNANSKEKESVSIPNPERYVEFTKNVLNQTKDKRRVLFFYANWCPTCTPADANFISNSNMIPEDVVLIRINYNDDETDKDEEILAKKYKITYQHTFVQIDENGEIIERWNGGQIEELLENIK